MGCVSSKQATSHSPVHDSSVTVDNVDHVLHIKAGFAPLEKIKEEPEKEGEDSVRRFSGKLRGSKKGNNAEKKASGFSIKFGRLTEGEHLAAGWPVWLTAVAGEAIDGWMPLKSNMFQKLEKIKCYMQQLLSGLEHCHSRGIMHRDIKVSNILVNNEGILKIADFGLANFLSSRHKQPLTSRVVTLWYRPPELLLGSTSYGVTVDLWSVGCVFAELFFGRPLLKGRTEVEQLHKIFKLCGTPPDDYWKRSKLPLATMFKPKQPYDSTLRDRCKELPKTAVNLIETLLSIDPHKRGTASSALKSEYFNTKPYACDSSSLPKYPPNKEIDAKFREEARRKRGSSTVQASETSRNSRKTRRALQEPSNFCKVVPTEEVEANGHGSHRNHGSNAYISKGRRATVSRISMKPLNDTVSETSQMTHESQGDSTILSVPVQMPESSGFAWAKKGKQDSTATRLYPPPNSRSQKLSAFDPSGVLHAGVTFDSNMQDNDDFLRRTHTFKHSNHRKHGHHERPDSFDSSEQELPMDYDGQQGRVGFSGPLLCQSQKFDSKQDNQIRKAGHRSRFYGDV
ncbi:protein IMPAIRED IN BABA-INDUCED STERILITY 1-like isoform X2 [Lycium ferocissimum]|uniref:protein IMPAIRED IN BABA-INDUCED STERILITY 1-like isoform X2 n=1 Tax=Lycium ferocissimum TaxID=112874 RepID=UPI0028163C79|nr:protein IMPAIRED IN BABA-INDUCED STERILITY 1-like isoform X2 [Lycium ferocissimum]